MSEECAGGCDIERWGLVAIKRDWVPEWLYRWFTPNAGTRQPWRWLLHRAPTDIERARASRVTPYP